MQTEIKQKWVEALRSGEFVQGKGMLRTRDGSYCCLGVLCVVAGLPISDGGNAVKEADCGYAPLYSLLSEDGNGFSISDTLWTMNDGREGKTFPEIADYIEANL